jgi:GNAT superfamily N-acetyltransferase
VSDQYLIRPALHEECALLTSLALRAKAIWGYSDQFMADCVAELTISEADIRAQQFFVLKSDSNVIGFCALMERSQGEHELAHVFVDPARLHEGHGRRLVEHAKDAARTRGWQSLLVESDPNAREFYLTCGGVQIGTVPSGSIPGRHLPLIKIPL